MCFSILIWAPIFDNFLRFRTRATETIFIFSILYWIHESVYIESTNLESTRLRPEASADLYGNSMEVNLIGIPSTLHRSSVEIQWTMSMDHSWEITWAFPWPWPWQWPCHGHGHSHSHSHGHAPEWVDPYIWQKNTKGKEKIDKKRRCFLEFLFIVYCT